LRLIERARGSFAHLGPGRRLVSGEVGPGQIFGDLATLALLEVRCLLLHDAVIERLEDRIGRHRLEEFAVRRLGHTAFMTAAQLSVKRALPGCVSTSMP